MTLYFPLSKMTITVSEMDTEKVVRNYFIKGMGDIVIMYMGKVVTVIRDKGDRPEVVDIL